MVYKTQKRLWQSVESVSNKWANWIIFKFTFGFVRGKEGVARVLVKMNYVASEKLDNLVGLGFVPDVQFTYVVRLVQRISTKLRNMFNVPSMMYATIGPKHWARMGSPRVISATEDSKEWDLSVWCLSLILWIFKYSWSLSGRPWMPVWESLACYSKIIYVSAL